MFSNNGNWTVKLEEGNIKSDSELHFFSAGTCAGTGLGCRRDCGQPRAPWLRAAWLCLSLSLPCRWRKYFHLFSPGTLWQCDVARECNPPSAKRGRTYVLYFTCLASCAEQAVSVLASPIFWVLAFAYLGFFWLERSFLMSCPYNLWMFFSLNEKKRKREDIHFVLQIQRRHKGCIVLALLACW